MKIFLDTADTEVIRKYFQTGLVDGVTTNPVEKYFLITSVSAVSKKIFIKSKMLRQLYIKIIFFVKVFKFFFCQINIH